MDLKDILAKKNFDEPTEIIKIKRFVRERYQQNVAVSLADSKLIVSVPSAALAGALRANLPELERVVDTDKKIVLRINPT